MKEIILWDLPGVGTPKFFNVQEYYLKIDLKKYDKFLIFTRPSRVINHDKKLVEKVSKDLDKPFFLVRTNIERFV